MNSKPKVYLSGVALVLFCAATSAHAEIVILSSGRTLSVKGHREDGGSVVLQMRSGGDEQAGSEDGADDGEGDLLQRGEIEGHFGNSLNVAAGPSSRSPGTGA